MGCGLICRMIFCLFNRLNLKFDILSIWLIILFQRHCTLFYFRLLILSFQYFFLLRILVYETSADRRYGYILVFCYCNLIIIISLVAFSLVFNYFSTLNCLVSVHLPSYALFFQVPPISLSHSGLQPSPVSARLPFWCGMSLNIAGFLLLFTCLYYFIFKSNISSKIIKHRQTLDKMTNNQSHIDKRKKLIYSCEIAIVKFKVVAGAIKS